MRISSCRFYCAGSFMRLPSFPLSAFHQAHYNILSCECGFFYLVPRADSMVRVPLYKFHTNSIVQISLCGCYCAHSTVRTPLCAFYRVHPIVCIPFYAFHRAIDGGRRTEEGRGKGGWGGGYIRICSWHQPGCINWECIEWDFIDWECINQTLSIRLYVWSRLLDLDFSFHFHCDYIILTERLLT